MPQVLLPQVEAKVAVAGEIAPGVSFNQPLYGGVSGQLFDLLIRLGGYVDMETDFWGRPLSFVASLPASVDSLAKTKTRKPEYSFVRAL